MQNKYVCSVSRIMTMILFEQDQIRAARDINTSMPPNILTGIRIRRVKGVLQHVVAKFGSTMQYSSFQKSSNCTQENCIWHLKKQYRSFGKYSMYMKLYFQKSSICPLRKQTLSYRKTEIVLYERQYLHFKNLYGGIAEQYLLSKKSRRMLVGDRRPTWQLRQPSVLQTYLMMNIAMFKTGKLISCFLY